MTERLLMMVYGYSVTIGPDGKPRIREFGNGNTNLYACAAGRIGSKSNKIYRNSMF